MKRTVPLIVLIGAAGLLVPILGVSGESPNCSGCKGQWASSCPDGAYAHGCCAKASSGSSNVLDELTAILKETKSTETFVVTAMVLGRMGPEAKRAIPAIIRNAERLELLEDMFDARALADNQNRAAAQKMIGDVLEMILDKKAWAKGRLGQNQPQACYPASPVFGGPSTCPVPASWNAPVVTPPMAQPVQPMSEGVPIKPAPPMGSTVVQ